MNEGFKQLAIIWMDIRNIVPPGKTLTDIFSIVVKSVKENTYCPGLEETLTFYEKTYNCTQLQKHYMEMKW